MGAGIGPLESGRIHQYISLLYIEIFDLPFRTYLGHGPRRKLSILVKILSSYFNFKIEKTVMYWSCGGFFFRRWIPVGLCFVELTNFKGNSAYCTCTQIKIKRIKKYCFSCFGIKNAQNNLFNFCPLEIELQLLQIWKPSMENLVTLTLWYTYSAKLYFKIQNFLSREKLQVLRRVPF